MVLGLKISAKSGEHFSDLVHHSHRGDALRRRHDIDPLTYDEQRSALIQQASGIRQEGHEVSRRSAARAFRDVARNRYASATNLRGKAEALIAWKALR